MSRKSNSATKPAGRTTDPIPCQLYLSVCPPAAPSTGLAERVAAILEGVSIPSLLVAPRRGERLTASQVLPLVQASQSKGVAVMIADDACLARTVKADGVHLTWSPDILDRYQEAREIAGGRLMIGADVGHSRHDAMVLAEAGAEYIAFGIPVGTRDRDEASATRAELVEWWAEVFEIPCVACDVETDDALALADAGADFVCIGLPEGRPAADLLAWAADLVEALQGEAAAAA